MIDARLKVRLLWTIFHHESMYKTRNLFRAKTAQKGFRVFDVMLFPPYPFHPLAEGSSISAAE